MPLDGEYEPSPTQWVREQVELATWRLLAGLPADQARRRYIALIRRLDPDT